MVERDEALYAFEENFYCVGEGSMGGLLDGGDALPGRGELVASISPCW